LRMRRNFNSNTDGFHQSGLYLGRPRLKKLLENAVKFPLVAVCAGTGYGKTRAVYAFLKDYAAHTTWIQLTERDNSATRFWESHTNMISLSWPETGKRLFEMGFPETKEAFAEFEALRREALKAPGKYILVYDDVHLLHSPAVFRFIERTLDTLPQNVTVMLLSRTIPDINMTGMMLRERVFTIYEDTLRFTEDEIAEYFRQLGFSATRQDIRDIYGDTQGWAFAVNLVGRSLCKDSKYERHVLGAMKANIFKLIESEIFLAASEPLRRFLLCISLIDHLAADLVRTLAKDETLIGEMEHLHAYIRYDSFLDAYVIHHLFLGYLKKNQYMLTDEEKCETHQKAGVWCENNRYHSDALSYYEKSGDWDAILRIAHCFDAQMPHDIAEYILNILERFPKEAAFKNPLFVVMDLKLKANLGRTDEILDMASRYAEYYEAQPESPEKNHALAGIYVAWGFSRLLMSPYTDVYDFDLYFEKHSIYYDKNPYAALDTLKSQPISAWAMLVGSGRAGAPEEYIGAISRSIPHISRVLNGNFYGLDDLVRGELCFFRRELPEAKLHLEQALGKARERGQYDIQHRSLLYLMHIAFAHGDFGAADRLLQSMRGLLEETGCAARCATTYDLSCGLYHLMLDRFDQIPAWLKGGFSAYTHPAFLDSYANLVKAKYHYQTRQYGALLAFIGNNLERQAVLLGKIELKILEALALYQLKRRGEAFAALSEAYRLAEPNNIAMPFILYGKDMRTLAAAAAKDDGCPIPKDWLEDMNRKASSFAKKKAHMISEYKRINRLEDEISLTKRETEVLRDLSQGLSRTEIAANHNISTNTVKLIINIIYGKLCVNSLPDAIRVAAKHKII